MKKYWPFIITTVVTAVIVYLMRDTIEQKIAEWFPASGSSADRPVLGGGIKYRLT